MKTSCYRVGLERNCARFCSGYRSGRERCGNFPSAFPSNVNRVTSTSRLSLKKKKSKIISNQAGRLTKDSVISIRLSIVWEFEFSVFFKREIVVFWNWESEWNPPRLSCLCRQESWPRNESRMTSEVQKLVRQNLFSKLTWPHCDLKI